MDNGDNSDEEFSEDDSKETEANRAVLLAGYRKFIEIMSVFQSDPPPP